MPAEAPVETAPAPHLGGVARWEAVTGGRIAVETLGSGPTVILLHGWTLDRRMWTPQASALADRYQVIAPDRRGCGASDAPSDLNQEWRDIDRLAGPGRIALVGLSQGAAVALDYALRRPDRVLALVLAGAPLHGVAELEPREERFPRDRYAAQVAAGHLQEMKAHWRAHPLVRVSDSARALVDAMLADYEGRDLLKGPHSLQFFKSDLAALAMPVLAMTGDSDTSFRRTGAALIATTAPHGALALLPGAGHLCNLDNPAGFNNAVTAFLDRHHR